MPQVAVQNVVYAGVTSRGVVLHQLHCFWLYVRATGPIFILSFLYLSYLPTRTLKLSLILWKKLKRSGKHRQIHINLTLFSHLPQFSYAVFWQIVWLDFRLKQHRGSFAVSFVHCISESFKQRSFSGESREQSIYVRLFVSLFLVCLLVGF